MDMDGYEWRMDMNGYEWLQSIFCGRKLAFFLFSQCTPVHEGFEAQKSQVRLEICWNPWS